MLKNRVEHIVFLIFSLLCLFLFFKEYQQYLDVSMADETVYMQRLKYDFTKLLGSFAPFYTLTYKFFNFFIQDYIHLHHFAIISLSWLPSVTLYFFLRSNGIPFIVSIYLSWCLLFSSFNMAFDWWPRISHYSIFIIFLFIVFLSYYYKKSIKIFIFFGFFALYMSFIRPEFMMSSFVLFFLGVVCMLYQKYKNGVAWQAFFSKKEYAVMFLMVLNVAFLIKVWHSPMYGGRMYYAMGQHYTFNTIKWNKQDRLPFIHWEEIFKSKFGNSQSVGDMYKANADELKKHIAENITSYIHQTLSFGTELFLPKFVFQLAYVYKYLILVVLFLLLISIVGIRYYINEVKRIIQLQWSYVLCVVVLIVPSVVASVVIFPREHYYILQLVLYYYLIGILLSPFVLYFKKYWEGKVYWLSSVLLMLLLVWQTPRLKDFPRFNSFHQYETPNYIPYIKAARNLNIKKETTFLVSEILPIYINDKFKICIQFLKDEPFDSLLYKQNIGMIYISDVILKDYRFYEDSTWNNFIKNYASLGWQKLQLPNKEQYIIYKKDLLEHETSTK